VLVTSYVGCCFNGKPPVSSISVYPCSFVQPIPMRDLISSGKFPGLQNNFIIPRYLRIDVTLDGQTTSSGEPLSRYSRPMLSFRDAKPADDPPTNDLPTNNPPGHDPIAHDRWGHIRGAPAAFSIPKFGQLLACRATAGPWRNLLSGEQCAMVEVCVE